MSDNEARGRIAFTKKPKYLCKRDKTPHKERQHFLKPSSVSKPILSKYSQKSRSKGKGYDAYYGMRGEKESSSHCVKNAQGAKVRSNNEETDKQAQLHYCWSVETSVQTKTLLSGDDNQKKLIRKELSCRQNQREQKKDRKLSQNIRLAIREFEVLKEEHKLEKKLMEVALNEREVHRLQKIYAVEETEYLINIINAQKRK